MKNLLHFLYNNNIRCFNPVAKSLSDKTCIALNCGAPSIIRKDHSLKITQAFLSANNLPYQVVDNSPLTANFKINIA